MDERWEGVVVSVTPAPALGQRVVDHLRRLIIGGKLPAGTHLVESRLSARFDVSRGPVRDALRQLEVEGLVESRRRGVFVIGVTVDDIEELYSLRQLIEAEAIALCVRRGTGDAATLAQALTRMGDAAEAGDSDAFAEADLDFHTAFYDASGHRRLAALWQQYRPTFAAMLALTNAEDRDLKPTFQDHVQLHRLISAGDLEGAQALLQEHIDGSRRRLLAAYSRSQAGEQPAQV
jgi:GntR family transcriptional regulator of gluconate operon